MVDLFRFTLVADAGTYLVALFYQVLNNPGTDVAAGASNCNRPVCGGDCGNGTFLFNPNLFRVLNC